MTPKLFRLLLIACIATTIASLVANFAFPGLIPEAIRMADEQLVAEMPDGEMFMHGAFALIFIVATVIGFIGLYTFKPWSRTFNLVLTGVGLLWMPFMEYLVISGWSQLFEGLGTTLWGAALAIAYLPPISERFAPRKAGPVSNPGA